MPSEANDYNIGPNAATKIAVLFGNASHQGETKHNSSCLIFNVIIAIVDPVVCTRWFLLSWVDFFKGKNGNSKRGAEIDFVQIFFCYNRYCSDIQRYCERVYVKLLVLYLQIKKKKN